MRRAGIIMHHGHHRAQSGASRRSSSDERVCPAITWPPKGRQKTRQPLTTGGRKKKKEGRKEGRRLIPMNLRCLVAGGGGEDEIAATAAEVTSSRQTDRRGTLPIRMKWISRRLWRCDFNLYILWFVHLSVCVLTLTAEWIVPPFPPLVDYGEFCRDLSRGHSDGPTDRPTERPAAAPPPSNSERPRPRDLCPYGTHSTRRRQGGRDGQARSLVRSIFIRLAISFSLPKDCESIE